MTDPTPTVCKNRLHDYPTTGGYLQEHDQAARRLRKHWRNLRCPDCGLWGWEKPRLSLDISDRWYQEDR